MSNLFKSALVVLCAGLAIGVPGLALAQSQSNQIEYIPASQSNVIIMDVDVSSTTEGTEFNVFQWRDTNGMSGTAGLDTRNGLPQMHFTMSYPLFGGSLNAVSVERSSILEPYAADGRMRIECMPCNWDIGTAQSVMVRSWTANGTTHVGMWTRRSESGVVRYDNANGKGDAVWYRTGGGNWTQGTNVENNDFSSLGWTKIGEIENPFPNALFKEISSVMITPDGEYQKASFSNFWARGADGSWTEIATGVGRVGTTGTTGSSFYIENVPARVDPGSRTDLPSRTMTIEQ